MEIVIDQLGGKDVSISVQPSSTIAQVKQMVQAHTKKETDEDVLASQMNLKYKDQPLEDSHTLGDYFISSGDTLVASRVFELNESKGRFGGNAVTTSQVSSRKLLHE